MQVPPGAPSTPGERLAQAELAQAVLADGGIDLESLKD
jgi:hypothetical protein